MVCVAVVAYVENVAARVERTRGSVRVAAGLRDRVLGLFSEQELPPPFAREFVMRTGRARLYAELRRRFHRFSFALPA